MNPRELIFKFVQRRHPRTPRYQSYASSKRILLLFESDIDERNLQIKTLAKQLQEDGKDVSAWGFVNKPEAQSSVLRGYRVTSLRDYNFWQVPKDYLIQDLTNERYDLLINLNMSDCLPLRYLSLYAEADFRAGKQGDPPYLSDFMVDVHEESNPAFLFDQIIHYLKNIQICQK